MDDPYRFWPTLGDLDLHLIGEGSHRELWRRLGARVIEHQGVVGVAFAVWAPNARGVSLVSDANGWDGRVQPMRSLGASGVWELFVPGIGAGTRYKFRVVRADGRRIDKADPLARWTEPPPRTASIVEQSHHAWADDAWLQRRAAAAAARPSDLHLRGAPRLLASHPGRPRPQLPRAGRAARRLLRRGRLHPRRAAAGERAPLRRLLGLSGLQLLRPDRPLRRPR